MTGAVENRGGAPVGFITELETIEAASVVYLRMWCDGPNRGGRGISDHLLR